MSDASDDSKIIERIQLLLNKAENTTFPEEAETFREHAERLIARHMIDRARLAAEMNGSALNEDIIKKSWMFKGNYFSRVQVIFWHNVMQGLGEMRGFQFTPDRNRREFSAYGFESDISMFDTLVTSLWLQAQTAMKKWYSVEGKELADWNAHCGIAGARDKIRGDFLTAFSRSVRDRLKARRSEALDEVKGTGTELVLASRQQQVDSSCGWDDATIARGATAFRTNNAGWRAGQQAGLGDTELANKQQITER